MPGDRCHGNDSQAARNRRVEARMVRRMATLAGLAVLALADTPSRAEGEVVVVVVAPAPEPPLLAAPAHPCCFRARDYRPRTQFVTQMLRSVEGL